MKENNLPHDVWMVTIWIIKGYYRMIEEMNDIIDIQHGSQEITASSNETKRSPVETAAIKRERYKNKIDAIEKAIRTIPEEYRHGVMNKVINNAPYPQDAAAKTYSRYKSKFIMAAAKYLNLD